MQSHYTLLDHTADLMIRVTGTDLADLFKNAGLALFDLIFDSETLTTDEIIEVQVNGDDPADLMVNYLRELLYLWTGQEKLVNLVDIVHISDTAVSAQVSTDRYQPEHHEMLHEIKVLRGELDIALRKLVLLKNNNVVKDWNKLIRLVGDKYADRYQSDGRRA